MSLTPILNASNPSRNETALYPSAPSRPRPRRNLALPSQGKQRRHADCVEFVIREKFAYLADSPGGGHTRSDLTRAEVRFLSVYSYLVVYRPETKPLQIVAILHDKRDVSKLLKKRV